MHVVHCRVIGKMYGVQPLKGKDMAKPKTNQRCECSSCDALFWVEHDMDKNYYPVTHCPFCGDELDIEEELELDYGEEYDV